MCVCVWARKDVCPYVRMCVCKYWCVCVVYVYVYVYVFAQVPSQPACTSAMRRVGQDSAFQDHGLSMAFSARCCCTPIDYQLISVR